MRVVRRNQGLQVMTQASNSVEVNRTDRRGGGALQSIVIPPSKSYANRALIRASIKKNSCRITNLPQARDTLFLMQCLEHVGLEIHKGKGEIEVVNSFPECEKPSPTPVKLNTGDGGTTNRFLLPFLALGKNEYHLYPQGRMMERPMGELGRNCDGLSKRHDHFKIQGPWPPRAIQVDCSFTTQIASAFLLSDYDVQVFNLAGPSAYLRMTHEVILNFDNEYDVRPDWSCASFPLVLAALKGRAHVSNLKEKDPNQADSALLTVLEQVGAFSQLSSDGLTVKGHLKRPFQFDCRQAPDLFPALTFLASYLDGESTLSGLSNLKEKESDRLEECRKLLEVFGVSHRLERDSLAIWGRQPDKKIRALSTAKDHRIVMAAYLFLRFNGGGTLDHSGEVVKSFPEFFYIME